MLNLQQYGAFDQTVDILLTAQITRPTQFGNNSCILVYSEYAFEYTRKRTPLTLIKFCISVFLELTVIT